MVSFSEAKNENDEINWEKFFSGNTVYEQIYNLEIIEELMEAGSVGDECKRVSFVEIMKKERKRIGKKAMFTGQVSTYKDVEAESTEPDT